jgi:hypothetical protein
MERIKKILYDMRSSLKNELRTKWMDENDVKGNNELQREITEVIILIECGQKQSEQQSNCNLTQVSNNEVAVCVVEKDFEMCSMHKVSRDGCLSCSYYKQTDC